MSLLSVSIPISKNTETCLLLLCFVQSRASAAACFELGALHGRNFFGRAGPCNQASDINFRKIHTVTPHDGPGAWLDLLAYRCLRGVLVRLWGSLQKDFSCKSTPSPSLPTLLEHRPFTMLTSGSLQTEGYERVHSFLVCSSHVLCSHAPRPPRVLNLGGSMGATAVDAQAHGNKPSTSTLGTFMLGLG